VNGTQLKHENFSPSRQGGLPTALREPLWAFVSTFVERPRDSFERILSSVDRVIVGRDSSGSIRALWAIDFLVLPALGRKHPVVYMHYAYVDPAYRKKARTPWIYLKHAVLSWARYPLTRSYFAYTASTFPSYLLMARNTHEGWPRRTAPTPLRERLLIRGAARATGLAGWDRKATVLKRNGIQRYREGVCRDFRASLADPDIAFYAEKNPGQPEGDSLFVIFPMSLSNVAFILCRFAFKPLRRDKRYDQLKVATS
jgi:hypothetical protein